MIRLGSLAGYDQSWKEEWIGEYSAPTTGLVSRRGPDGSPLS